MYSYNINITPSPEGSSSPVNVKVKQVKDTTKEPVKLYLSSDPYAEPIICNPLSKSSAPKPSVIKRIGQKSWKSLKKIRPSHIAAMAMFAMMCFVRMGGNASGPQTSRPTQASVALANAYEQGAQHVRDSIRIANLEQQNKLMADSLKMLRKLPK